MSFFSFLKPKPRKARSGEWKTKDGQILKIRDMKTSHIENCIRLIERKVKNEISYILNHPPCFEGEMAQYYAEQAWDDACEADWQEECQNIRVYRELCEELNNRIVNDI